MNIEEIADAIVEDLFTNGFCDKAVRLVMISTEGRDIGGWGRPAVRSRVLAILHDRGVGRAQ